MDVQVPLGFLADRVGGLRVMLASLVAWSLVAGATPLVAAAGRGARYPLLVSAPPRRWACASRASCRPRLPWPRSEPHYILPCTHSQQHLGSIHGYPVHGTHSAAVLVAAGAMFRLPCSKLRAYSGAQGRQHSGCTVTALSYIFKSCRPRRKHAARHGHCVRLGA